MTIVAGYIVPHPPLAIAEIGSGEEQKIGRTLSAYQTVAERIAEHEPETIVFISPHSAYYADWIYVGAGSEAAGDMSRYNAPKVQFRLSYDDALRTRIIEDAHEHQIPAGQVNDRPQALDHGLIVPLYFIEKHLPIESFEAVSVGGSGLERSTLLSFGASVARAAHDLERRTIIVASGDLSHKLLHSGPYGYNAAGPKFDEMFCDVVRSGDAEGFARIDKVIAQDAAECGLSGFIMMAGALKETEELEEVGFDSELLSYEGPFGVGYGVASYEWRS